jgi:hypothetical protein
MIHNYTDGTLDKVEHKQNEWYVLDNFVDNRNVSSLRYVSSVGVSGRQFFPGEGIREVKQAFDPTFAITVTWLNVNHFIVQNWD